MKSRLEMDFFTQKEKDCLAVYVTDLLGLMEEEHTSIICDSRHAYHKEEIQVLAKKIDRITPCTS